MVVVGLVLGCMVAMAALGGGGDPDVALQAAHSDGEAGRDGVASAAAAQELGAQPVVVDAGPEELSGEAPRRVVAEGAGGDERVAALVADLRDDGVRWNGTHAVWDLIGLPPGRLPALEDALSSADEQQRAYAAAVLRLRHLQHGGRPAPALLTMSVASLCRGGGGEHGLYAIAGSPRVTSVRFLARYAAEARDELLRALDSFDPQQRFFAAWLLAQAGIRDRVARCAFVLVEHLRDNDISGDALLATQGLYRLGEAALPVMAEARRYADEQARRLLDLIELDLRSPPKDVKDLRARRRLHEISGLYHDPAIEFDIGRSVVPSI